MFPCLLKRPEAVLEEKNYLAEDARQHFKTLGLEPGASAAEIKAAYRELAVIWHPDRFMNAPQLREVAQSKMAAINTAYHFLKSHHAEVVADEGRSGTASINESRYAAYTSGRARTAKPADPFTPLHSVHVLRVPVDANSQGVTAVAISTDGSRVIAASGATMLLWDTVSGQKVYEERASKGVYYRLAVAPNGRYLAVANNQSGWMNSLRCELRVCDPLTGKERHHIKLNGHITSLAFSPDGKQLAGGDSQGQIRCWEAESGQEVQTLPGGSESGEVWRVAYVDGGQATKQIIALKQGKMLNEIEWWEVRRARLLKAYSLHFRECLTYGQIRDVAPSPDGSLLLVANNDPGNHNFSLKLWTIQTDTESKRASGFQGHTDTITSIAYAPDGNSVLSGSEDKTVRLWDEQTGKERARGVGHSRAVRAVAFSADGSYVVSGSDEGTVRLWKV